MHLLLSSLSLHKGKGNHKESQPFYMAVVLDLPSPDKYMRDACYFALCIFLISSLAKKFFRGIAPLLTMVYLQFMQRPNPWLVWSTVNNLMLCWNPQNIYLFSLTVGLVYSDFPSSHEIFFSVFPFCRVAVKCFLFIFWVVEANHTNKAASAVGICDV